MAVTGFLQQRTTGVKEQWLQDIRHLIEQVADWAAQEPEWKAIVSSTELTEDGLGPYTAPVLTIDTPQGRLILEPIARNYPGKGIVELYAWPTLFRVRLLYGDAGTDWRVRVDSGFTLHQNWNRENFITLANDLLSAS